MKAQARALVGIAGRPSGVRFPFSATAAGLAVSGGLLVLVGWAADVVALKSVVPGLASMKAHTALSFVLAGASLAALGFRERFGYFGLVLALGVAAGALLALARNVFALDPGPDELLFGDAPSGRMAPVTAILFVLVGSALVLLHAGRAPLLAQALGCLAFLLSLLCCLSYLYGLRSLQVVSPFASVAVHTAALSLVLSVGVLAAAPATGPVALFLSGGTAGVLVRRLLPAAVVFTVLLGWIRLNGQRAGWYGTEFGAALFALSAVVAFAALVFWAAEWVRRAEAERARTDGSLRELNDTLECRVAERTRALRQSEERFRLIVEGATEYAIFMLDPGGRVVTWNAGAERIKGYSAGEIVGQHFARFYAPELLERNQPEHLLELARTAGRVEEDGWRVRKDGSRFWANVVITALHDESGGLVGFSKLTRDLTARKRTEEELRGAAAFNRGVLDALSAHVAVVDRAGVITAVNRAWERYAEQNPDPDGVVARTGVGTSYLDVCARSAARGCADARAAGAAVRDVLARGEAWSGLEYQCMGPAGPEWFAMSVTPLGPDGGAVIAHTNVSERERAERARRFQEEQFRSAFEDAPIGMALVAPDGRWVRVNRAVCAMLGYSADELLATDFQTVTHPDDLGADLNLRRQVLAGTMDSYQIEKRYFRKDGCPVHALLGVSLVRDGDRAPVHFISQIQDITERKRAEEALRDSEERYRSVVEALAEGVVMQDPGGRVVASNDRAHEILGLTRDQLFGLTSLDPRWRAVHEGGAPFPGADHPAMVSLRTGRPVFNTVMGVHKPDGALAWLTINAVPVRAPGAAGPKAVVVSFSDVTPARLANDRLRASLRDKEVMLKEIHHRVKNNLAITISMFNYQMRGLGAGPAHEALRQAQDRVRSMALVHEMLYQSTSLSEVDLPGYVGQLVRNLSVGYAAGTRVKTVLDLTPVALPLDTSIPFGLIVNELVSNAFKYAFPDDRRGTLTVALRGGADRAVELEVRDDGPGLPADLDPFATRSLGLRLVRDLARQIGGSVAVRRTGGTAFVLSFPAPPGGCPPRADHPGSEP